MRMRIRLRRWTGVPLLVTSMVAVGCAQVGGDGATLPTSPSALSAGPVAFSETGVITTMAGPGAGYNATGSWHGVFNVTQSGDHFVIEGDVVLTHHGDGTITFSDDTAVFTFTPRGPGTGRIIPYALSAFGPIVLPNSPCETRISGTARLDTGTDTITVDRFSGVEDDCENVSGSATLTRN